KGDTGSKGDEGRYGVSCWDLNQDDQCNLDTEDVNHDGACDVLDCRGAEGTQGAKGDKGDNGDKGDTGTQGAKGDTGTQGSQGSMGPQGPKGDAGVAEVYRSVAAQGAAVIPSTGSSVTLTTVNLSAGTYLINAKMWLSNTQTSKTHYVKCSLVVQDTSAAIVDSDSTTVTVVSAVSPSIPGATALPFVIANSFPTAITVTLNCQRLDSSTGSTT